MAQIHAALHPRYFSALVWVGSSDITQHQTIPEPHEAVSQAVYILQVIQCVHSFVRWFVHSFINTIRYMHTETQKYVEIYSHTYTRIPSIDICDIYVILYIIY